MTDPTSMWRYSSIWSNRRNEKSCIIRCLSWLETVIAEHQLKKHSSPIKNPFFSEWKELTMINEVASVFPFFQRGSHLSSHCSSLMISCHFKCWLISLEKRKSSISLTPFHCRYSSLVNASPLILRFFRHCSLYKAQSSSSFSESLIHSWKSLQENCSPYWLNFVCSIETMLVFVVHRHWLKEEWIQSFCLWSSGDSHQRSRRRERSEWDQRAIDRVREGLFFVFFSVKKKEMSGWALFSVSFFVN